MARRDHFSPVFQRMIDAPATSLEALRSDPATFERLARAEEDGQHEPRATIPYRAALGFLLFDGQGQAIALQEPQWVPQFPSFEAMMTIADVRSGDGRLVRLQVKNRQIFGLWSYLRDTGGWNIPQRVRQAAGASRDCRIVLLAGCSQGVVETAVQGFGLTNLQQRVACAVVRTGSLREAAAQLEISYATAREVIAAAAKRMFVPNTPALVRTLVMASFGILPGDFDGSNLLADMLRLTERQARLALLISAGASRDEAARALGSSPAVVKKELEALFASFGLQSAAELSRFIVEVQALRVFARSIDGAPGFLDPAIEPTRFTVRPNGIESIGWSDYGPASGKPVLIVHSNWCCRAVPRPLLTALQREGWRPIAIDRPGFGATHVGNSSGEDPFSQAVADTAQVLNACGIERIAVIARCGAQFTHQLKAALAHQIGPVVLVSPTPPTSSEGKRTGVVGAVKEAFFRRPRLIEFFFRIICAQISLERVDQLTRAIVRGSKVDEALCDDPQFIRDRFRALRPFATGNFVGGILEEQAISVGGWPAQPLPDASDWAILQGTDDNHNGVDEVRDYWARLVPDAAFTAVEGGGRFLTSSHADLIVRQLGMLSTRS